MRAEILTIGDELCRGEIVDTNSSYLAQRLWDLGITTRWMTSCCDDVDDITSALVQAVERADVVVCSGGLGPTEDDLTVDMVAKLAGLDVVIDEVSRERMELRFGSVTPAIPVTKIQLRQVRVPAGARVYVNPQGLAPCFEVMVRTTNPVAPGRGWKRASSPVALVRPASEPGAATRRAPSEPSSTSEDGDQGPSRGRGAELDDGVWDPAQRRRGSEPGGRRPASEPRGSGRPSSEPRGGEAAGRRPASEPRPTGSTAAPRFPISRDTARMVPIICLPGIPRELHAIFDAHLETRLRELTQVAGNVERIARRIYRVFGRGESQISQACRGMIDGVAGASIHYQVKFPETLVKLVVRDLDQDAADARLAELDVELREERLPGLVYATGEENLPTMVTKKLMERGITLATAESCTGGLIGAMVTELPGSSKAFKGGAIVYTNAEKVRQLGVRSVTLDEHGAVSEQTVREMAEGACKRFDVDIAVAVSGVAGPDGGTPEKPVGTVWIAAFGMPHELEDGTGTIAFEYAAKKLGWPGMRDQIRTLAAWWAFKLVDDLIERRRPGKTLLVGERPRRS
jgi:PncC family amidohydrolase